MSTNDSSTVFLYGSKAGRALLEFMLFIKVPKLLGAFLRSPLSHGMIDSFIKKNQIPMDEFKGQKYRSFNDFFTRKKEITFDKDEQHFISPCDSLLSVYNITKESSFHIKGADYTISDFLQNKELEASYSDGLCLVFRLCATDYHRYCYIDDGAIGKNHYIEGKLYSVQPLPCEKYRVYTKNRRSWAILSTKHFGDVAQIEVGAFSVGGIKNHHEDYDFKKGEEKGYFDLHGSTIVLLIKKDKIKLLPEIEQGTANGCEYRVKIGQHIANACIANS